MHVPDGVAVMLDLGLKVEVKAGGSVAAISPSNEQSYKSAFRLFELRLDLFAKQALYIFSF